MIKTADELHSMSIRELAILIGQEWPKVKETGRGALGMGQHPANPYWDAMLSLESIDDQYMCEDGRTQVLYFLSNAASYRGENAKAVRAELKRRLAKPGTKWFNGQVRQTEGIKA